MASKVHHLPHDVVIDILSRLPAKSLIRFICVCKSWYATITHPSFITTHLNRATSSHNKTGDYLQYIKRGPSEEQIWCFLYDPTYTNCVELKIPFNSESDWYIVGSYNGLVCLSELSHFGSTINLWNPSIRKFKTLPSSSVISKNYCSFLGFGFHFYTDDYKVVKITYFRDASWNLVANSVPQVEVYSLKMDSWETIDTHVPCFAKFGEVSVFIKGSVHWLASKSDLNVHQCSDMIMSFDFGDEVFREIMLPNYSIDGSVPLSLSLGVLKGSLSLCVSFRYYADKCWTGSSYIWVMKEYGIVESWTKQFSIVLGHGTVKRSLGFTKNDELLLEMTNRDLISYDPESLQYKHLATVGGPYKRIVGTFVETFVETLILLDHGNAVLGQQNSFDGVSNEGIRLGESRAVVEVKEEQ